MDNITLDTILNNKNADNEIYSSDLSKWLGEQVYWNIPYKEREELRNKLSKLANGT